MPVKRWRDKEMSIETETGNEENMIQENVKPGNSNPSSLFGFLPTGTISVFSSAGTGPNYPVAYSDAIRRKS